MPRAPQTNLFSFSSRQTRTDELRNQDGVWRMVTDWEDRGFQRFSFRLGFIMPHRCTPIVEGVGQYKKIQVSKEIQYRLLRFFKFSHI
jgi:hypothetical protein